jgi:hypothetical protein
MNGNNLFAYKRPEPDFRIPFRVIPSVNDILSSARTNNSKFSPVTEDVKKWRKRARERAVEVFSEQDLETTTLCRQLRSKDKRTGLNKQEFFKGLQNPFFDEPVACLVCLWRPTNGDFDVHNLFVKPIFDGFADVRLYEIDAVRGFPEMAFSFEGVDPSLKLSDDEKRERKEYQDSFRNRGKEPPRLPLPARIHFDFYKLARLRFGTLFQFDIV